MKKPPIDFAPETGLVEAPSSWLTIASLLEVAGREKGKPAKRTRVTPMINRLLELAAVPTHVTINHNNRRGYNPPTELAIKPEVIDDWFGPSSLMRVLDPASAAIAGLRPQHFDTLADSKALSPANTRAAGVRHLDRPAPAESAHRSQVAPLVAQVGVVDYRMQPVFGTEGLIHAFNVHQDGFNHGSNLAKYLFTGVVDRTEELRELAVPAGDVALLTTRGLDLQ